MFKRIVKGDMNIDIEQGRKIGRNGAKKKGMIDFDFKMLSIAFWARMWSTREMPREMD